MNELQVFNFEGAEVRTVMKDGEAWWVLKDVCDVLDIANNRDAASRLDGDEKADVGITDTSSNGVTQNRTVLAINESGLYSMILLSRKPEAKAFKRWITHEVLPSIRKHGVYAMEGILNDPRKWGEVMLALADERDKRKALETTVSAQHQQIAEMAPKASYCDIVLQCEDALPVSVIAKDYGKSGRWLNNYLHDAGVQFKQSDIWLLYQQYAGLGYTRTRTHNYLGNDGTAHASVHTYWTQKGRLFIYELLKIDGVLPLIEQERPAA
jgi:prophage antirepressor-like protein